MANKIKLARGTKSRIESIKSGMLDYELVYSTDTNELAVKKPDGNVKYIGINLDEIGYMNHAAKIFYDSNKRNQFKDAWEHSLTVDPSEIERESTASTQYGTLQYPDGAMEGIIIPHGVTSISDYAFYDWISNNQPLVIPNSVTSIGNYAFRNWRLNNQPLVIPNSVTSIGDNAFSNWTSNNQPLVIPNSVTSIGNIAFYGWEANKQPLVIPNSVTSIANSAFNRWLLVPYIEMKRTTPPTLANGNAFSNQNDAPIYVPDESVDAYKTATNWVDLADRIFSISDKASSGGGGLAVEEWDSDEKTLALSDANKLFRCSSTGNKTLTIPPHNSVPFPIGTMITFVLINPGKITFVGASDVFINSMDSLVELATPNGMASLIKTYTNAWQLVGALE